MARRMNRATQIVQRAQQMYPERLNAAVNYIGKPDYGKERIDRKTADSKLVRMLPEQLQALAQTDPKTYMEAQQRLETLRQRASTQEPLPAQADFEGDR